MKKQPLLNTYVNNLCMYEVIDEVCRFIEKKEKSYVVPINVDVVVKAEKDSYLKRIIDEATLTLVDGMPLIWISKIINLRIKEKVSGSDLVPQICKIAAEKGYKVFMLGGAEGVAEKAKRNLENDYKGIKIVGTYSPPIGFEKNEDELIKINNLIDDAKPDVLIACFGCPKQEKWVFENYMRYNASITICAGATVDFIAGNVKRAPKWMSNHGLEWLFRTIQEPRRMFRRYFIEDIRIIGLFFKYGVFKY